MNEYTPNTNGFDEQHEMPETNREAINRIEKAIGLSMTASKILGGSPDHMLGQAGYGRSGVIEANGRRVGEYKMFDVDTLDNRTQRESTMTSVHFITGDVSENVDASTVSTSSDGSKVKERVFISRLREQVSVTGSIERYDDDGTLLSKEECDNDWSYAKIDQVVESLEAALEDSKSYYKT